MQSLVIAAAQLNFRVGDIAGNARRIRELMAAYGDRGDVDLLVLPELALSGYPPEDLLYRPAFIDACDQTLRALALASGRLAVLIGHPVKRDGRLYNAASLLRDGRIEGTYLKHALPNYAVFDEKRYFDGGHAPLVFAIKGSLIGVLICEDGWEPGAALQAQRAGAELLVVINASPYALDKVSERHRVLRSRQRDCGLPALYLNLVGGQDELVFDGQSFALSASGRSTGVLAPFAEAVGLYRYDPAIGAFVEGSGRSQSALLEGEELYAAVRLGLHDYVAKSGFEHVLLGLSGGVDSALVLTLAADAFGPTRVHAVMMPTQYTSTLSLELAAEQARALGVRYTLLPIHEPLASLDRLLAPAFRGLPADITEENLQSRTRGLLLMALSNKLGGLLLATGNKSEYAVGYATLYGDMCGAYAPIKDLYKTRVYQLCRFRNRLGTAIPQAVIDRAPSAELRHNQQDQDSLPAYEVLDAILERYLEHDRSAEQIVAEGFDADTVLKVVRLVHRSEYKRRQAPPGARVTPRAFGRDRRYPIASGWKDGVY